MHFIFSRVLSRVVMAPWRFYHNHFCQWRTTACGAARFLSIIIIFSTNRTSSLLCAADFTFFSFFLFRWSCRCASYEFLFGDILLNSCKKKKNYPTLLINKFSWKFSKVSLHHFFADALDPYILSSTKYRMFFFLSPFHLVPKPIPSYRDVVNNVRCANSIFFHTFSLLIKLMLSLSTIHLSHFRLYNVNLKNETKIFTWTHLNER